MEDQRPLDGSGIDTQQERNKLNYRPTIEYTKPFVNSTFFAEVTNEDVALQVFTQPKATATWGRAVDIYDQLNTIENDFSGKLKDSYAVIPDKLLPQVINAAGKFGYQIKDSKLPFSLYKKVLQSNDSHEKIILQDAFENYQADVNGSLIGELYPDIVEIQQDWGNTLDFIRNGLFAQIVNKTKVPTTNLKTDSALSFIDQQEKVMSDAYLEAKKSYDQSANEMRKQHLIDHGSADYFAAQAKFMVDKQRLNDLERRMATKNEVMSLVGAKADHAEPFLLSINNYTNGSVYKGKTFNLLYALLSQYTSGQEMESGLRKVQALLKLSIDGKIENTDGLKTNIRSISSNQSKQNVNKSLVKSVHLRNEVYGEVFDTVNGFVNTPSDYLFDMVAGHIVDSVARADDIYTEQTGDYYKINMLDVDLRREKLLQLVDKDTAREFYQIIDSLISYAKQGRGWPSYSNLTSWLQDFINYKGL